MSGTRRWVTPGRAAAVQAEFAQLVAQLAAESGTQIELEFAVQGEALQIDPDAAAVRAFQAAYTSLTGAPLPFGDKPFVDDGNTFSRLAGIPALTHGPAATGAHTLNERVTVDELVRVAQVYALTAIGFCGVQG